MFYPRAMYFLYFAALSALLPYLALFYQERGMSGRQIGTLSSIVSLAIVFGAPLWGFVADSLCAHRAVLLGACAVPIAAVLGLSQATTFVPIMLLVLAYAAFSAPIIPLVDNATMAALGERRHLYGRQRLWGSVGWVVFSPLVGWIVGRYGVASTLWIYAAVLGVGMLTAWRLPISRAPLGVRLGGELLALLRDPRWAWFLGFVFCAGMMLAMINFYLIIYANELGLSRKLFGWMMVCSAGSELPLMFFSAPILRRFGTWTLLVAAMTLFIVRMALYPLIDAGWAVLAVQFLHGPAFGLIWIAGVTYSRAIAPGALGATAQGMFISTMLGLGSAAGAWLGGALYEALGIRPAFAWMTAAGGVGLLLLLATRRLYGAGRAAPA